MSKAKLSQIKETWVDEEVPPKKERTIKHEAQPKKQQTFNLQIDAISRLWMHRAKTGKTISATLNELVIKHVPKYD